MTFSDFKNLATVNDLRCVCLKIHLRPLVALAAVRSKVAVLLLLIHCLLLLTLFVGVLCLVFVF